jgi:hypothetical protein
MTQLEYAQRNIQQTIGKAHVKLRTMRAMLEFHSKDTARSIQLFTEVHAMSEEVQSYIDSAMKEATTFISAHRTL